MAETDAPVGTGPVILVMVAHYPPAFRAGGSLRSVANLVKALRCEFQFKVITSDCDFGDKHRLPGIVPDVWIRAGETSVLYLSKAGRSWYRLFRLLRSTPCDVLYLNSLFARRFSIFPLLLNRFGVITHNRIVLAPRGELSAGALQFKRRRKRMFLWAVRLIGLHVSDRVIWQASSPEEAREIAREFGRDATVLRASSAPELPEPGPRSNPTVVIAEDLGDVNAQVAVIARPKQPREVNAIFLSRIARKKNLDGALRMLRDVKGLVRLDVYGSIEDREYWNECMEIIRGLPANIAVEYRGDLDPDRILEAFASHHLFIFPTHGENYGHVIREALLAGCPVLTSDRTPWRGLEGLGVGWDLPLERLDLFHDALQRFVDMDSSEFSQWSQRARAYGLERNADRSVIADNRQLLQMAAVYQRIRLGRGLGL